MTTPEPKLLQRCRYSIGGTDKLMNKLTLSPMGFYENLFPVSDPPVGTNENRTCTDTLNSEVND